MSLVILATETLSELQCTGAIITIIVVVIIIIIIIITTTTATAVNCSVVLRKFKLLIM
jgi:hypothetical protein